MMYIYINFTNNQTRSDPRGWGPKFQNEIFCPWRELEGGRTWKKWTKYILAEKFSKQKVILTKFSEFC